MVLTPREASRNPSYHSTPIRGAVTAEPVFGDEVLCHRHTGKMPPSGLGPPFLVQALKPAGGHFNEREMAVVRGVRSRRGQKITDAKFQIVRAYSTGLDNALLASSRAHASMRATVHFRTWSTRSQCCRAVHQVHLCCTTFAHFFMFGLIFPGCAI